jgi:hypothetical protein
MVLNRLYIRKQPKLQCRLDEVEVISAKNEHNAHSDILYQVRHLKEKQKIMMTAVKDFQVIVQFQSTVYRNEIYGSVDRYGYSSIAARGAQLPMGSCPGSEAKACISNRSNRKFSNTSRILLHCCNRIIAANASFSTYIAFVVI